MLEWRRFAAREIVGLFGGEVQVRDVEGREDGIAQDRSESQWGYDDHGCDDGEHDDDDRRRKDAACSACVEGREIEAGPLVR